MTFPCAFASTAGLVTATSVISATAVAAAARIATRTATGLTLSAFNTSNVRIAVQVDLISVGRWL